MTENISRYLKTFGFRGARAVKVLRSQRCQVEIEDIIYFQRKLYRSLNVPLNRLEQETTFSLGRATEISRDELKFQKFIDRLRMRFAGLFMGILKTQLVLKGVIAESDWSVMKEQIHITFERDNHFAELKDAEIFRERIQTLDAVNQYVGEYFTKEWVMRNILRYTDDDIEALNRSSDEPAQGDEE